MKFLLTLLLALLPALALAQGSSTSIIQPDLDDTFSDLGDELGAALAEGPVTVAWLLDQGEQFRLHEQGEALALGWETLVARLTAENESGHTLSAVVAATGGHEPHLLADRQEARSAAVKHALRTIVPPPAASGVAVPDVMGNAAVLAQTLAGIRGDSRHLVVFCLDWIDTEHDLERTLAACKKAGVTLHVIGRTAFLSDAYWILNPPRPQEFHLPKGVNLAGAESAFRELPTAWLFDLNWRVPQTGTATGPYGWTRIAGATGGTYHIYFPETEEDSFCEWNHCPHLRRRARPLRHRLRSDLRAAALAGLRGSPRGQQVAPRGAARGGRVARVGRGGQGQGAALSPEHERQADAPREGSAGNPAAARSRARHRHRSGLRPPQR